MPSVDSIFEIQIVVMPEAVDANGHANNVEYIQWMQDAAARHSDEVGCTRETIRIGATWVVRSHQIEYLRPSHEGDTLTVRTWISNAHRVRSMRKYEFKNTGDGHAIAKARTEWILVDVGTGRPRTIPEDILGLFKIVDETSSK